MQHLPEWAAGSGLVLVKRYTIWNSSSDACVVLLEDLHVCLYKYISICTVHGVGAAASAILYTRCIKYHVLLSVLTALGPIELRTEW